MQDSFLRDFNDIAEKQKQKQGTRFPLKITAQELIRNHHYPIQEVVFIATQYHPKTVAARIIDDKGDLRTFYLPDAYANKFRENFEDPKEFNTYLMYLVVSGFRDEEKLLSPFIKFIYQGDAQME